MARASEDVKYRGRRRWNGSHGKVWFDGELVFEIESFECTVEAQREDVIIGNSVDSKITSLKVKALQKLKTLSIETSASCMKHGAPVMTLVP